MVIECDFIKIYKDYYQKITRYLSGFVGPSEAEDLAQEVFDKINRNLGGFKGKSKLSTWVYRIATNAAIDRLRSASYKQSFKSTPLQETHRFDGSLTDNLLGNPSADEIAVRKEMSACVNEYIHRLPLNYRTILVLNDMAGLSYQEIADILQISLSNVKVRLHRARAKLKKELNKGCDFYYNEEGILACDRKQFSILPKPPK